MRTEPIMIRALVCSVLLFSCLSDVTLGKIQFRTVALTGEVALGVPGEFFTPFSTGSYNSIFTRGISLNNRGYTSFKIELSGGREAIYTEANTGRLQLIAVSDSAPAATPEHSKFQSFSNLELILNDSGITAFAAAFVIPDDKETHNGIWVHDPVNGSELVARGGIPLPGQELRAFPSLNIFGVKMNRSGSVVGHAIDVVGQPQFVFIDQGRDALQIIAQVGTTENFAFPRAAGLADSNDVVIQATHTGYFSWPIDDNDPHRGVWLSRNNELISIERTPITFGSIGESHINAHGDVVFAATRVELPNSDGIYKKTLTSSLETIVEQGDRIPGFDDVVTFEGDFGSPLIDASGRVTFRAMLSNGRSSLWRTESNGSLRLLALAGTPISGHENLMWSGFGSFEGNRASNQVGQLIFSALVTDADDPDLTRNSYWLMQPDGQFVAIVAEGDLIEVNAGDKRTIFQLGLIQLSNNQDGRQAHFNDFGQLAFSAQFTDGTVGVFVSSNVFVPEPISALLLLFMALAALGARSRSIRP